MNKNFEIPGIVVAVLIVGIGLSSFPQWSGLWTILAIAVLMLAGSRGTSFLVITASTITVVTIVVAKAEAFTFLLLSIIPGCVVGYLVARSSSLGRILAGGFATGVLGFGLVWLYQFWLQGIQLGIHSVEAVFAEYFNHTLFPTLEASGLTEYYEAQGFTEPVLRELFDNFLKGLAVLRPGLYILQSWVQILLGVFLGRFLLRERGLIYCPPFTRQRMAWQLDWIIILGLIFWLSGDQWNMGLASQLGANVIFLMAPIAFYFGLSLTAYLIRHWRVRPWLLVIIGLAAIFFPTQVVLFITILGVFDPLIDYRNLDRGSPA